MNTEQDNKDILKNLFSNMPEETLPDSFRINVMQQVMRESVRLKKRNERWGLLAVILASLTIVSLSVIAVIYAGIPKISMPKIDLPIFNFYLFIGALTLILLLLDYKLRQLFHKDE